MSKINFYQSTALVLTLSLSVFNQCAVASALEEARENAKRKLQAIMLKQKKESLERAAFLEANKQDNDKLYDAVYEDNVEEIKRLFKNDVDLNVPIIDIKACMYDYIFSRYDNKYRCFTITPLQQAALMGSEKAFMELLELGADPADQGNYKCTLLHLAAWKHNKVITKILIDREINLNRQDKNGLTPLHTATTRKSHSIVQLLLQYEANPNVHTGEFGLTPLHLASGDSVRYLLENKRIDPNLQDMEGMTALNDAASANLINIVKVLTSYHNVDLNLQDKQGMTPLCTASWLGHHDIIEILVNRGADLNVLSENGSSNSSRNRKKLSLMSIVLKNADLRSFEILFSYDNTLDSIIKDGDNIKEYPLSEIFEVLDNKDGKETALSEEKVSEIKKEYPKLFKEPNRQNFIEAYQELDIQKNIKG